MERKDWLRLCCEVERFKGIEILALSEASWKIKGGCSEIRQLRYVGVLKIKKYVNETHSIIIWGEFFNSGKSI